MNLHEYQAKQLFKEYGIPVPVNYVASNVSEAVDCYKKVGDKCVIKAQVHAGGRGKAGGVKIVNSQAEVEEFANKLLGSKLVTYQTDEHGQPVNKLLLEEPSDIAKELYLGAVLDRTSQRIVIMASTEGGVDIEYVAQTMPDKILKIQVNPLFGVLPYQCRDLAFGLGLDAVQTKELTNIVTKLAQMFVDLDLSLIEVNPLIINKAGNLICLDGKLNADDNALYRQPKIKEMFDATQEDPRELKAKEWELNYVSLTGNIGCMVNGAGLAMATMDLIKLSGGAPANFLDVGGGATAERVTEAFKIILSDPNVKGVLVNIFGGIVKCDLIAEGIIKAVAEVGVQVPVVVRLEGNRSLEARALLNDSKLNIIAAKSLQDAADQVVAAVGGK